MPGPSAVPIDFLVLLALTVVLYAGLAAWLHRTGSLRQFPRAAWALVAALLVVGWFWTADAERRAQGRLREQISRLLPTYATEFERLGHHRLDPENLGADDPLYLELIATQVRWLSLNPFIADIYTFRRTTDGRVILVVDSETDYDHNGRYEGEREQRTTPGEIFGPRIPELERAFAGERGFRDIPYTDRWGTWVSGFEPLHDDGGAIEAVIGVDFESTRWIDAIGRARLLALIPVGLLVGLIGLGGALLAGSRAEAARRAESERQLREQSQVLRLIFDQAPGGITLSGLDRRFREANASACRLLGYTREELLQRTFLDLTHPDDLAATRAMGEAVLGPSGGPVSLEKRYLRRDGSFLTAVTQVAAIRDDQGRPLYHLAQITDLSELRRAEARLREQESRLETVLRSAPLVLMATDRQGVITVFEGAGVRAVGREPGELVGRNVSELFGDEPAIVVDLRRGLAGETFASRHERQGVIFEVQITPVRDSRGKVVGLTGVALDVTRLVRAQQEHALMERRLLDTQKLESLGVLASGVAHDFNNLLTSILGNAALGRIALPADAPAHVHLDRIEQASQTAAALCRQLLVFSGGSQLDAAEVDLTPLVEETAALLKVSLGENTQLEFALTPGLPPVLADAAQFRQIVLNLVLNAAQAIGNRPGTIRLATSLQSLDASWFAAARVGQESPPGPRVCLVVSDDGPGMDAATLTRIFDPFFTTKPEGRGLGLASVLGIVRSHDGALQVRSEAARGTSFTLAFPPRRAAPPAVPVPTVPAAWRGTGRVLVVDDEASVRRTTAQMVAYFGFDVAEAESGVAALKLLEADPAYDLVLLDATMPDMDGAETLAAIRRRRPAQRVVVFSGYSSQDTLPRFASQHPFGFLQKPFSPEELRETLRAALEK